MQGPSLPGHEARCGVESFVRAMHGRMRLRDAMHGRMRCRGRDGCSLLHVQRLTPPPPPTHTPLKAGGATSVGRWTKTHNTCTIPIRAPLNPARCQSEFAGLCERPSLDHFAVFAPLPSSSLSVLSS